MNIPAFIKCHAYTTVYEQGKHTPTKGVEVNINIHHIVAYTTTLNCSAGSTTIDTNANDGQGVYRVWETLHVVEAKIKYALDGILMAYQNAQR